MLNTFPVHHSAPSFKDFWETNLNHLYSDREKVLEKWKQGLVV
jgi:hypothetical protein